MIDIVWLLYSPAQKKNILQKVILFILLFIPLVSHAQHVKILVIAIHGIKTAKVEWQPTIDHLQNSLPQHTFSLIPLIPSDLPKIDTLIANNEIDFIITQPAIYVDLEMHYGISRILTLVKKGGFSEFGSTIITHVQSKIISIDDLSGKVIAGVSNLGFGGWLIGYKEMLDHGFDPYKDAKSIVFLGTQTNEIYAVLERTIDAAVIRTGVLEKMSLEGEINLSDFHVLAVKTYPDFPLKVSTPLYPEWAFAKTLKASNKLSKSVALALLSIDSDSTIAQKGRYQEWTLPYDYQPVHKLMKQLKVGSYSNYGKVTFYQFINQHKYKVLLSMLLFIGLISHILQIRRSNLLLKNEKKEKEELALSFEQQATHDVMTGLSNRRHFEEYARNKIAQAQRSDEQVALLYIDLDNFKDINDKINHKAGDQLLSSLGERLTGFVRKNELVARIGGDEFCIVIFGCKTHDELENAAKRLIKLSRQPFNIGGMETKIGMSIGISIYPDNADTFDKLLSKADEAMYKVKNTTKENYAFAD